MTLSTRLSEHRSRGVPAALDLIRQVAGRAPALDERLRSAGFPEGPADADEFDTIPVLSKDSLPSRQSGRDFGGLLTEGAGVVRAFASPGPIYEPQLTGADPWRWVAALEACGIGPGHVVLNCFNYHLSPAGMMFDEACRAVGAVVVPAGVGMTEVQVQVIADLGVTAYIGLPSYLATLVKAFDAAGLAPERWLVTKALVTAEPLPPSLRATLTARVPDVLMAYGTAEAGLIGHEVEPDGGLRLGPGIHVQLCDPATGAPVGEDESGEVVVSVLHPDYPLIRFGTGDVSRWMLAGDELRLAGVLGRVGAAIKVRGMFVHPHQAAEVLARLRPDGAAGGAFVVENSAGVDEFRLEVVVAPGADRERLAEVAERRCRDILRVRPTVEFMDERVDGPVLVDLRTA